MWIARSGAQWRELPEKYGPWQTVYSKFRKWEKEGILELVFKALTYDADMENLSIDSQYQSEFIKVPMGGKLSK